MSVLLVEDDPSIVLVVTAALETEGLHVVSCGSVAERDLLLTSQRFDVMVSDVVLSDGDGIATIDRARELAPDMPVIIVSAQNTLDTAVRASDTGAFEYFPKPFDIDQLARAVLQAAKSAPQTAACDEASPEDALPLVGRSAAMQDVYRLIVRVLRNDLTVLVLGESGTGKELVAEAIHTLGKRSNGPFVAVNTAAIPSELIESELFGHEKGAFTGAHARYIGKFEQAHGGTLFLDEIGDMPMQAQTRLLRALQSGTIRRVGGDRDIRIDTRIIAATNRDLEPMISAGTFREDLFYRLNVVPIALPPLRDRTDDIPALARHFLYLAGTEGLPVRQFDDAALSRLKNHRWRGNVRELRNAVFRLALLAREDTIDAATVAEILGESVAEPGIADEDPSENLAMAVNSWLMQTPPVEGQVYDSALAAFEAPLFRAVLRRTGGNQIRAAQMLGINRNTLRKRLSELGIDPSQL